MHSASKAVARATLHEHPASRVPEPTPRLWKQNFTDNPLRSDLYKKTVA